MPSYAQPEVNHTLAQPQQPTAPPVGQTVTGFPIPQGGFGMYGPAESGYGQGGVENPAYPGSPNYTPPSPQQPQPQAGGAPSGGLSGSNVDGGFFLSLVNGKPPSP